MSAACPLTRLCVSGVPAGEGDGDVDAHETHTDGRHVDT